MDYNQCSVKWNNGEIGQPLKKLVKWIDADSEVGCVNENTPLSFSFYPVSIGLVICKSVNIETFRLILGYICL